MAVIGSLWWLWLLMIPITGAYIGYNQIQRIKRLAGVQKSTQNFARPGQLPTNFGLAMNNVQESMFNGLVPMLFAAMIGSISVVLLVISVVVNVIH